MSDKKNNLTSGIQKLNEDNLDKVSGGWTDAKDAVVFFMPNTIPTTCDKCGAKKELKVTKENWRIEGHIMYQNDAIYWTCEKCGGQNSTYLTLPFIGRLKNAVDKIAHT